MYRTIKRIYDKTGDIEYVKKAVAKGWITEEEYKDITGEEY
jgi:hypothetical protein